MMNKGGLVARARPSIGGERRAQHRPVHVSIGLSTSASACPRQHHSSHAASPMPLHAASPMPLHAASPMPLHAASPMRPRHCITRHPMHGHLGS